MGSQTVKMIEAAKIALIGSAPASLKTVPDGKKDSNKWYNTALGHLHVWLWNFPRGFLYHDDFFTELMPDRLAGSLNTPFVVTTFLTQPGRTLRMSNYHPEECDYIKREDKDNSFWHKCENRAGGMRIPDVAKHTASIPILFRTNNFAWPPYDKGGGWSTVDGCISSGYAWENCDDDCIVFVATYDFPSKQIPKPPRINWAGLPWIGAIVKAFQVIGGVVNDNCYDDMYIVSEIQKYIASNEALSKRKVIQNITLGCEQKRKDRGFPERFDFKRHTPKVVEDIFEEGLIWAKEAWKELSAYQRELMAKKGCTIVGMGGACNGIFQAAVYAFYYEKLKDLKKKLTEEGQQCQTRVFNLLAGDSCGGINACFFANLQDLDEAGKLHLVVA